MHQICTNHLLKPLKIEITYNSSVALTSIRLGSFVNVVVQRASFVTLACDVGHTVKDLFVGAFSPLLNLSQVLKNFVYHLLLFI